jgi:hypothetical protein
MKKYNYNGEDISEVKIQLSHPEYGYIDKNGNLCICWHEEDDVVDRYGFDKRNVEKNGEYVDKVELPVGTELIRYGGVRGRFTAPKGTKYNELSLPYDPETIEYHEYIVVADGVKVNCCKVIQGRIAPMFDSKGGGIQYLHLQSIRDEVISGKIKEIIK